MEQEIAIDPASLAAKSLADMEPGSVVHGRAMSGGALGIVLRDANPAYATRYLLTQDERGLFVVQGPVPSAVLLQAPGRLRLLLSEPHEGRGPGRHEELPGYAGVDSDGAFLTIDAREHGSRPTIATICCRDWNYRYSTDRAFRADLFFRRWQLVLLDEFGNRFPVLEGAAAKEDGT